MRLLFFPPCEPTVVSSWKHVVTEHLLQRELGQRRFWVFLQVFTCLSVFGSVLSPQQRHRRAGRSNKSFQMCSWDQNEAGLKVCVFQQSRFWYTQHGDARQLLVMAVYLLWATVLVCLDLNPAIVFSTAQKLRLTLGLKVTVKIRLQATALFKQPCVHFKSPYQPGKDAINKRISLSLYFASQAAGQIQHACWWLGAFSPDSPMNMVRWLQELSRCQRNNPPSSKNSTQQPKNNSCTTSSHWLRISYCFIFMSCGGIASLKW